VTPFAPKEGAGRLVVEIEFLMKPGVPTAGNLGVYRLKAPPALKTGANNRRRARKSEKKG
jgi:hypothetical protein